jgi:hypothetical protein
VASGLIHDWIAAAFIPDAKLDDVLSVVRDYDRYKTFYGPNVIDSKSLSTDGPADKFSVLLVNKAAAETALEGEFAACYLQLTETRWYSVAYTTRVQEIHHYGHPGEQKLPPGKGSGYIWQVYNVTRFEQRDGGVYIEQKALALSRDIPAAVRWVVDPIVRRLSKEALLKSLRQTQDAVRLRTGVASPPLAPHAANEAACGPPGLPEARSADRDPAPRP